MELTVEQILKVTPIITSLINENRPMPLKGKYRLTRWHMKLKPEWDAIQTRRDELIRGYDNPFKRPEINEETGETTLVPVPDAWQVPDDKMPEFTAAWAQIVEEKISFPGMEPIPFEQLDLGDKENGSLSGVELMALSELIAG